ncbi:unnamed protein product [Auanema sp. JU1783]|nr:unnamed protein product [Auanema sp. JU1783]
MSNPTCDLYPCGYTVQRWIGHCFNGLGDVFLARCNDSSRITIKRILIDCLIDPSHVMEEVKMLKSLRHQHILEFHASFVYRNDLLIASPTCSYGSALDIILSAYPSGIPEKAIAILLSQLLKAVSYLHNQDIVHRSIRASHLLIESTGNVRLTGFRCSSHLPKNTRRKLTEFDKSLEGSLLWLAPEVLAQDLNGYGVKSDIYSIGITLCELANGFPPFSDMEPLQMLYEKGRGTVPKLLDSKTLPDLDKSTQGTREFSEAFHDITEQSLKANQYSRPNAAFLLQHPFVRKSKKSILDYIPSAKTLDEVEKYTEKTPTDDTCLEAPEWSYGNN